MKLTKSEESSLFYIGTMKAVENAFPYNLKQEKKKGIILLIKNGDIWRIPWYTNKQAVMDAYKISQCYVERQDGTFYLLLNPHNFTK